MDDWPGPWPSSVRTETDGLDSVHRPFPSVDRIPRSVLPHHLLDSLESWHIFPRLFIISFFTYLLNYFYFCLFFFFLREICLTDQLPPLGMWTDHCLKKKKGTTKGFLQFSQANASCDRIEIAYEELAWSVLAIDGRSGVEWAAFFEEKTRQSVKTTTQQMGSLGLLPGFCLPILSYINQHGIFFINFPDKHTNYLSTYVYKLRNDLITKKLSS